MTGHATIGCDHVWPSGRACPASLTIAAVDQAEAQARAARLGWLVDPDGRDRCPGCARNLPCQACAHPRQQHDTASAGTRWLSPCTGLLCSCVEFTYPQGVAS